MIQKFMRLLAALTVGGIAAGIFVSSIRAGEEEALAANKPAGDKKAGPAAVKPTVSGVFKGNDKEAKLAHVSAH